MMAKIQVGIVMGSKSDLDVMSQAAKVFDEFGVEYEMRVLSAHRTPEEAVKYISGAEGRGLQVIIAGAGGSAHLAGVAAAHTVLPVLSIPVKRSGHDHEALFSNVMMPPGIPLATMPENGGKNTALLAIEIMSLKDKNLAKKYLAFRKKQHDKVLENDKQLQKGGWQKTLKN
jgi:5-(carboxyamino)imidazole ribonucleotide mutase